MPPAPCSLSGPGPESPELDNIFGRQGASVGRAPSKATRTTVAEGAKEAASAGSVLLPGELRLVGAQGPNRQRA